MGNIVSKFLHTRMRVSNLEETVKFYQTVFGLEVSRRHESPRGSKLVFLAVPNSDEEIESGVGAILGSLIGSKVGAEIDRLESEYAQNLESEVKDVQEGIVEKVDSYLNYVIENWMKESLSPIRANFQNVPRKPVLFLSIRC